VFTRSYLCFLLLLVKLESCSPKPNQREVTYLKEFFTNYAPCIEDFYCYEYSFDVVSGQLQIDLKLFNYKNEVRFLKETSHYIVPIDQIRIIDYFQNNSEDIIIIAEGDFIKRLTNGNQEYISALPLDFNKYKLTKALKTEFEKNLDAIAFHSIIRN
jgi:hypothetical protein